MTPEPAGTPNLLKWGAYATALLSIIALLNTTWPYSNFALADNIKRMESRVDDADHDRDGIRKSISRLSWVVERSDVKADIRELKGKRELTLYEQRRLEELLERKSALDRSIANQGSSK